jgi:hypothetical protein
MADTWSAEARAEARKQGLYLVKALVNGRWVKNELGVLPSAKGVISVSGSADESDATVLWAVIRHLAMPGREPPEWLRAPTVRAFARMLRQLLPATDRAELAALLTQLEEPPQPA